jgi:alanyl-tRNA synthetase
MKTDELREKYLAFFETKGCVRRPSDALVPHGDPSVLFTPAGMNQFKDHFLGKVKLDYTRAATCQKCLRTGDIENVGRTAYHHTFFEMLGNFSFGDYFKREAINWAWEFLTKREWLGLDPDRLFVSVYLDDDEAAGIWARDIKLPGERIKRMGEDDNFWPAGAPSQGPDGVCGPCSEIFYKVDAKNEVEIWNLVFTQFNRVGVPPNNLRPLPSKNIDTGMGLERTAAVMQNVTSNFHIDILLPLVEGAAEVCRQKYDPASENGRRLRRIADHVRACTFAIHENVYPGPNKKEYVVKRLLRRAVLDGRQIGLHEPFLHKLVPLVAQAMHRPYPELGETIARVAQVIEKEESNFFSTIDVGLDRIERLFGQMKSEGRDTVSGTEAAEMYTTHGFPPELFETLAAEHNLGFNWDAFNREMEQHGRDSGGGHRKELFQTGPLDALKKTLPGTIFLGYETTESAAQIVGIVARNELVEQVDEVGHDEPIRVVLDKTPFYGESGGQVGDMGEITGPGFQFDVVDTQKEGSFTVHLGHLRRGKLEQGASVKASVDAARRQGIRRAHSATHILHYVLQKTLGKHAQQRGSKVDFDSLRFDFTNPEGLGNEVVAAVEAQVNDLVASGAKINARSLPLAQARETGAMMLFGEKYPDVVRMISIGSFSKELCGGTHLDSSAEVGLFKIVGEESAAAGTRRITALTGGRSLEHVRAQEAALRETAELLRVPPAEVPARVAAVVKELRDLKKQMSNAPRPGGVTADKLLAEAERVGDVRVVVSVAPGADAGAMRQLIDQLRKTASPVAVLLGSGADDKVTLVAGISRDLEQRGLNAGEWIRSAAQVVGGRGGGKPDMAQAGGKHPEKISEALDAARADIRNLLKSPAPASGTG